MSKTPRHRLSCIADLKSFTYRKRIFPEKGWCAMIVLSRMLTLSLVAFLAAPLAFGGAAAQELAPQTKIDEKAIQALIDQLGDEAFARREAANKRLVEIGEPAIPLLEKVAAKSGDLETRIRATIIIRAIGKSFLLETVRFDGHKRDKQAGAWRIAVSPDSKTVVTAGSGVLRYWDVDSGKELASFGPNNGGNFYALSLSEDGKRVIGGGQDRVVHVFDVPSGKLVQEFKGHTSSITGALLLRGGKEAVSSSFDPGIFVWDIETGKKLRTFEATADFVRCMALAPDGKTVAAAECLVQEKSPGVARLYDAETGKIVRTFSGHRLNTTSVAFTADGEKLLASGYDGVVRVWDIKSGKELKVLDGGEQGIAQAVFSADGKRLIVAGQRRIPTVRVWDIASGKMIVESDELGDAVYGIAALADPQRFLSASGDGAVRVWRLKK